MSDQSIEQEIVAKGLTAPRITPDDIAANISSEHYFTAADGIRGANDLECESGDPLMGYELRTQIASREVEYAGGAA